MSSSKAPLLLTLFSLWVASVASKNGSVSYDSRSIIVNGKRDIFLSGSIHYPRSTPDMWPKLLDSAKAGGLNVIQTYVFWNVHEPVQGQYNFEGNADLVKFIRLVQEKNMYVTLRLGPFIQAEWNHGGFPYWIRDIKGIIFRTNNEPFKYHMQKFVEMIIQKMKDEKLFAPQGGPIIIAQIENEYNNIQRAYKEDGANYVQWAGNMAVGLNIGIPWVMCKQKEAPDPIINTCNGRNCGDNWAGPNRPNKPSLWTENWTAQYRVFGDPPSQRSAEDLAFSVARFFSKNGTLVNYYMYHGGTNFGRTGASFVMTRYYDEAPLDEYGLHKNPKWSHLRDLHSALRLCKKALLWGNPSAQFFGEQLEARIFEKLDENVCAAFLTNNLTRTPATVNFRGQYYYLPPHSISILPDCKTVVYNTQTVVSQHNTRNFEVSKSANNDLKWEMYREKVPTAEECPQKFRDPQELFSTTKDMSDYLWYSTTIELGIDDVPRRRDILPVLQVANLGHVMHVFANGEYSGTGHGDHIEKTFTYRQPINLQVGHNHIQLLGMSVGFVDSGPYLEHRMAGVHAVSLQGLNTGTLDLTNNGWGHQVGVDGEIHQIYTEEGSRQVEWSPSKGSGPPLTWYKTYFNAPEGTNPVALNLTGLSKGMVWVNGNNIGRYWVSYLSPLGRPSQSEYHVPRSFLKEKDNLMVIFDEAGGDPSLIKILTVNRDTICSFITDYHPPHVKSWKRQQSKILAVVNDMNVKAQLQCPKNKLISKVEFASFGNPTGSCGGFVEGNCTVPASTKIVEKFCLGKEKCAVPIDHDSFFKPKDDPCPGVAKSLAIQVRCTHN